tara:strand:- start:34 stop:255 length:222 start_codon:yes stop_codon:yes gene_type:complete
MNPHKQGYTKKLGDTLRENEKLKAKVAALEAACTYDVMSMACAKFPWLPGTKEEKWTQAILEALKETNTPGGE